MPVELRTPSGKIILILSEAEAAAARSRPSDADATLGIQDVRQGAFRTDQTYEALTGAEQEQYLAEALRLATALGTLLAREGAGAVHCSLGRARSPLVVAAYLIVFEHFNAGQADALLVAAYSAAAYPQGDYQHDRVIAWLRAFYARYRPSV